MWKLSNVIACLSTREKSELEKIFQILLRLNEQTSQALHGVYIITSIQHVNVITPGWTVVDYTESQQHSRYAVMTDFVRS